MRLWHPDILKALPRAQLLGQHRECCAMRGNGWGRNHATVRFVWRYGYGRLVHYHRAVMAEMRERGYCPDGKWEALEYRGRFAWEMAEWAVTEDRNPYPEHDAQCLADDARRLRDKMERWRGDARRWAAEDVFRFMDFLNGGIM